MTTGKRRRRQHAGFSQMEMLVVLGVIAALAGMAWPRLHATHGIGPLREGSQRVRIQLIRTRLRAIETGQLQVFRYRPGSGEFAVALRSGGDLPSPQTRSQSREPYSTAHDAVANDRRAVDVPIHDALPDGVTFAAVESHRPFSRADDQTDRPQPARRTALASESANDDSQQRRAEESDWVELPPFLPDGTCGDARLRLVGEQGATVEVVLQGLTGIVTIGEIQAHRSEENQALP